jgi:hypothetical protein
MDITTTVITVIVGGALTLACTVVAIYLKSIKAYMSKQDDRIEKTGDKIEKLATAASDLHVAFACCKVDCDREFVLKGDYLAEVGKARRSMDTVSASLNRIEGQLTVMEKVPQLCGEVVKQVVSELNNGRSHG